MTRQGIDRIRERINVRLFTHKVFVLRTLRVLSFLVSLFTVGVIIYYFGFPKTSQSIEFSRQVIFFSIGFYIFKYLTHVFYDFHPIDFIMQNALEGFILGVILLSSILYNWYGIVLIGYFNRMIGFDTKPYILIFVQLYFLIIVGFELGKASMKLKLFDLGPSRLMTLSFILLISVGTGLLMLPEMTTGGIGFIDALFTSTSASCVTGLTVVNTAAHFTLKGQLIIMMLIQLGGINIVSFATFFATFYRSESVRYQSLLRDFMSAENLSDTRSLLRRIIFFSIIIEAAGAILIMFSWGDAVTFSTPAHKIYYSVFHSISAFNNAGFSLFSNNLYEQCVVSAFNIHMIIALLIILGGIGFSTMVDVTSLFNNRKMLRKPWQSLSISSRIVIKTTVLLIIAGAAVFMYAEWDASLSGMGIYERIVTAVFQSVSSRTAGFNTVDFAAITQPVLVFFIFLMFVGASPGGTGGGIKTTTFVIILKSALATIRGKKNVETYHHNISFSLIDKAYSIALFGLFLIFFSTFLLTFTEPDIRFLHLIFEEVSAFGTVGLSTGITPLLSDPGKIIIILSMFIGRIGPLTLALFLSRQTLSTNYSYPNIQLMVG